MRRKRKIGYILLFALFLLAVTSYFVVEKNIEKETTSLSGVPSKTSEASSARNATAAASSPSSLASIAPKSDREGPEQYSDVKSCFRYKRLSEFYAAKMSDPTSPLGNPELFRSLPKEQQDYANETMRILKEDESKCFGWASSTDHIQASLQIYSAARSAANRGDEDAISCYVLASWQTPPEQLKEYKDLSENYRREVPRLLDRALEMGSWRALTAIASNLGEQRGLRANSGLLPAQKYLVARLAQLGASDSMAAAQHGSQAAAQSEFLSGEELRSLDGRASTLYATKFGRSKYEQQDILDRCVN